MVKTIAFLITAIALAVSGVKLAQYAEADDAPGGVVVGWVLVIGALVLGVKVLQRISASRRRE
jgi:hypothetical protein